MAHGQKLEIMEKAQKNKPGFPKQPAWFEDARGFANIEEGLKKIGFPR